MTKSTKLTITSTIKLNNGVEIPRLGLGTWKTPPGKVTEESVAHALKTGYRHIDTAAIYQNEAGVGRGGKLSGVARKDVFITTKLWNEDHDDPEAALSESLRKLGTDYVDLYLMHWPVEKVRIETWKKLEALYAQKKCRAIGVSNFTIRHMEELLKHAKIIPAINQVEFSPYLYQKELL